MSSKAERLRRKKTVVVNKAGRPRRGSAERYPGGQIRHSDRQSADPEPMAVARSQPHRSCLRDIASIALKFGIDPERLAGSSLGRLFGRPDNCLQRHQYEAGVKYGEDVARDRAILGLPAATTQAIEYGRVVGGGRFDPAADEARKAAERLLQVRTILACVDCPGDPYRPSIVVRQIALEDRDEATLNEHEIGALRLGLNALARLYGVEVGGDREVAA